MLDAISKNETWKAHNGFKSGFYVEVEIGLQKLLPGTTFKAQPNIESKVKFWKEKYGHIADMIRLSGFAWNHATNSIEVDLEDMWKEYENFNPKVKGMNGKAFPMYESWQILFGIDRATGDFVADAADLDNCDPDESPNQDEIPNIDDYLEECYTPRFANGEAIWQGDTFKKAKKEVAIPEALGNYLTQSATVMEKIADVIGYDKQLSSRRERVFDELLKLDMDEDDRYIVNAIIVQAEVRVDTFYGILASHYGFCWSLDSAGYWAVMRMVTRQCSFGGFWPGVLLFFCVWADIWLLYGMFSIGCYFAALWDVFCMFFRVFFRSFLG
ncbi:hypothetical protein RHSIM_Rhsim04G0142600 [Rhododendron simsii]|uniref:Myb/SANT-like domain-containing protein n=1 Tax=Rhododendron simsii TaxID=118357 RepID=A0A834H7Z9_RHOSS|nr:hypothetical protein RHSIM_Rhsim04G0142600 [Rhododendron simsii]